VTPNAPINGAGYPYPTLSTARLEALRAVWSLQQWPAAAPSRIGELFALSGYVETYFAENLCSGVPLGNVVAGNPVLGPTLTTSQLYQTALAHFDSALKYAVDTTGAADSNIVYLAMGGKARVLLDSGDFADASTLAALVSPTYSYAENYTEAGGQTNVIGVDMVNEFTSVSNREGENGLDFVSAGDPRVV